MKQFFTLLLMIASIAGIAQIQTPQPSSAASVSSVVGLTDVKIDYSRPKAKGRKIFGEGADYLVPFGQIWRTGANNGTKITFSDDVKVEGTAVAKGEYLIFSWPGAAEWTISLYKDIAIGGNTAGYDQTKEAARFKVKAEKLTERVETFTMGISDIADNNSSAKVQISWENTTAKFTVAVDYDAKVMKSIEANTKVSPGNYTAAANYYLENGKDLKKALEWIDLGIAGNPGAFWNIHTKAKIQKALGDKAGAIATAQKSLELATKNKDGDFGYIKLNEDLIKSLK